MKTTCIIIEDEPLAQTLLEQHLQQLKNYDLLGKFENPLQALDIIQEKRIDVIFLDINMPGMTGLGLLQTFTDYRPHIVFTTAFPEYAIEAFDYNVVDYLVKPISFERFVKAINKIKDKMILSNIKNQNGTTNNVNNTVNHDIKANFIWIKVDKKQMKIYESDIIYIEGMGDYLKIHLVNKTLITHTTMSSLIELLDPKEFVRVHKSYIVRLGAIKSYTIHSLITVNDKEISVGVSYQAKVKDIFYLKNG
jgi:two-component system, LytTR family, response regulator